MLNAHHFDLILKDSHDECQMEFIELQADVCTQRGYSENILVDFSKLFVCGMFLNLSRHARKMTSLFGSTYCCEQFS